MAKKQMPGGRRSSKQSQSDPMKKPCTPETLDRTVIALPLLDKIHEDGPDKVQHIIIDVNLEYPGGRKKARDDVWTWIEELPGVIPTRTAGRLPAGAAAGGN